MWFIVWAQAMTCSCKAFACISWMWPWSFDFETFMEGRCNHGLEGLI
jgi:hypothetical protein